MSKDQISSNAPFGTNVGTRPPLRPRRRGARPLALVAASASLGAAVLGAGGPAVAAARPAPPSAGTVADGVRHYRAQVPVQALDNLGVAVASLPRMYDFYTQVLGMHIDPPADGATEMSGQLGTMGFFIFQTPTSALQDRSVADFRNDPPGYDHLVFSTPDLSVAEATLKAHGITIEAAGILDNPGPNLTYYRRFKDPEGRLIGVVQSVARASVPTPYPALPPGQTPVDPAHAPKTLHLTDFDNEGISARNLPQLRAFYVEVLGYQASPVDTEQGQFVARRPEASLFVFRGSDRPTQHRHVRTFRRDPVGYDHQTYTVTDIRTAERALAVDGIRVRARGTLHNGPETVVYRRFSDPEGNLVAVNQHCTTPPTTWWQDRYGYCG